MEVKRLAEVESLRQLLQKLSQDVDELDEKNHDIISSQARVNVNFVLTITFPMILET